MSVKDFVLFLAAGKLLTWLAQTNGLTRGLFNKNELSRELIECDLCTGFWVYLGLAIFQRNKPFGQFIRPVEWGILAAISTMAAHLISIGWQDKFSTTIIDRG